MVSFNKRLTRILEESGALDTEQIEAGLAKSTDQNISLSDVVLKEGWLEEKDLLGLLAERLKQEGADDEGRDEQEKPV